MNRKQNSVVNHKKEYKNEQKGSFFLFLNTENAKG